MRVICSCVLSNALSTQDDCIDFLLKSTKVPELKAASLISIGRLCRKLGSHLSHRTDDLVAVLSAVLLAKGAGGGGGKVLSQKKTAKMKIKVGGVPAEALTCISDMVCGMGR